MAASAVGFFLGGPYVWIGFGSLFLVFPLIEFFNNKSSFDSAKYNSKWANGSLYLTPLALTICYFFVLKKALVVTDASETIGIILSAAAVLGGFGITSAHELVHRRAKWQRALGVYNLMLVNFGHWGIEHVFGHHKYVATPDDPATSRKNENVYTFWLRSYFGVLKGAFKLDRQKVFGYWFVSLAVSLVLFFSFGLKILLMWWGISIFAILLLQTVDYIEHYGLVRPKNQDGFYMAFKPHHAWDTSSPMTNVTLFNLGFHSHHHAKANVQFSDLVKTETSLKMPYGYSVMIILALLPFVFIPMMNKKIPN